MATADALLDALLSGDWDADTISPAGGGAAEEVADGPSASLFAESSDPPSAAPLKGVAPNMMKLDARTSEASKKQSALTAEANETTASVLNKVEGLLEKKVLNGKISAEEKADIERRHHLFEMYADGRITEAEFAQMTSANTRFSEVAVTKPDVPEEILNRPRSPPRASHRSTVGVNVMSLFQMRRKKHALFSAEAPNKPAASSGRVPSTKPLVSVKPASALPSSNLPGKKPAEVFKSSDPRCFQRIAMDWSCAICGNPNTTNDYHCMTCMIPKDFYFEQEWRERPDIEETAALYRGLCQMGFPELILALVTFGIETPADLPELHAWMKDPDELVEIAHEIKLKPEDHDRFKDALRHYLVHGLITRETLDAELGAEGDMPQPAVPIKMPVKVVAPPTPSLFKDDDNGDPDDIFHVRLSEMMVTASGKGKAAAAAAALFATCDDEEEASWSGFKEETAPRPVSKGSVSVKKEKAPWPVSMSAAAQADSLAWLDESDDDDDGVRKSNDVGRFVGGGGGGGGVGGGGGGDGGGGGGGGGASHGAWACPACTYSNTGGLACGMCDAAREPSGRRDLPPPQRPKPVPVLGVQVGKNRAVNL